MYRAAWYAWLKGTARDAEEMARCFRKLRDKELGGVYEDTLSSMALVALSRKNQGRWNEAEGLQVQVMETRKRVLGKPCVCPQCLVRACRKISEYWFSVRFSSPDLQLLGT